MIGSDSIILTPVQHHEVPIFIVHCHPFVLLRSDMAAGVKLLEYSCRGWCTSTSIHLDPTGVQIS